MPITAENGRIKLHHIGIFTAHPKRLLNFYLVKLGFKKESESILPRRQAYTLFRIPQDCTMARLIKGDLCVEIFWAQRAIRKSYGAGLTGYNHFGFEISGRDTFCYQLRKKFGIRAIKIKRQDHYTYFLRDPDKNLIEIREPAPPT